jgi:predicted nucleic acid-binding protein
LSDYADTSLVVSYLTPDAKSQDAKALLLKTKNRVFVTEWTRLEFENAVNLRRFRGEATEADVNAWLADYETELAQGIFEQASLDYPAVIARARKLAAAHTHALGTRSFDIFHVAAALELSAAHFLTFDLRQAELARAAGLAVIS